MPLRETHGIEEVHEVWEICKFYMQGLKALKKPRSLARETKLKELYKGYTDCFVSQA